MDWKKHPLMRQHKSLGIMGLSFFQRISGPPSTMVDVSNYPDIKLVRAGAIAYEAIEKVVEMATKQR
ncbi:hypothetical protein J7L68_01345 [bacterium]|nr:hypothetical protein [bacterium]